MKKTWKVISGFDKYEISSWGEVRNIKRQRLLKHHLDIDGYPRIGLYPNAGKRQKMFKISRLVAIAFIPNPENKPEVNHKDGDKTNNRVSNLEWATSSENSYHAFANGLKRPTERDKTRSSKLTLAQVLEIKKKYDSGISQSVLAKEYGMGQSGISAAILSLFRRKDALLSEVQGGSKDATYGRGNGTLQRARRALRIAAQRENRTKSA